MASAALEGFITGFAGTLNQNIMERKKDAKDYFDKQVEYARTKGLENRTRVKQQVDANLSIAQQLEAVGVPREVIMAQINQNPEGLGDFFSQVEEVRATAKRDLTAEEWNAIYKVSGNFSAKDEDMATFISRTYDPIANAVSAPDFQDDPEGSLWASMMGYDSMDRARKRLGETIIAEGLTADELIRYGDTQPQRVGGNAVVTTDYGAVPRKPKGLKTEDDLTISEINSLLKSAGEQVNTLITEAEQQQLITQGSDVTDIRDRALEAMIKIYPGVDPMTLKVYVDNQITNMANRAYTIDSETAPTEPEEPATGSEDTIGDVGSQNEDVAVEPPVEPPVASSAQEGYLSQEEVRLVADNFGFTSMIDKGNGLVEVTIPGTGTRTYRVSDLRDLLRSEGLIN